MSGLLAFLIGASALVAIVWAWAFHARSGYHSAKAAVYQEFADTFSAMGAQAWVKDKARKRAEQKRQWMRLVLCDPVTADALRDALAEADDHWKRCPDCKRYPSQHGWDGESLTICPAEASDA
jgi:hypothetical protein